MQVASRAKARAKAKAKPKVSLRAARTTLRMRTTTQQAASPAETIGSAVAPTGWTILEECPALSTEAELQELIGKVILHGWDSKTAVGWFIGTVQSHNLSATDLKKTPSANFVVKYNAHTTDKALNGAVACELSARTHGPAEWSVLVVGDTVSSQCERPGPGEGEGERKKEKK